MKAGKSNLSQAQAVFPARHVKISAGIVTKRSVGSFIHWGLLLWFSWHVYIISHSTFCLTAIDLTKPVNIMFGLFDTNDHLMSVNHIIVKAKQTIFLCCRKNILPPFNSFLAKLKNIVKIEEFLAKQKKQNTLTP